MLLVVVTYRTNAVSPFILTSAGVSCKQSLLITLCTEKLIKCLSAQSHVKPSNFVSLLLLILKTFIPVFSYVCEMTKLVHTLLLIRKNELRWNRLFCNTYLLTSFGGLIRWKVISWLILKWIPNKLETWSFLTMLWSGWYCNIVGNYSKSWLTNFQ